MNRNLDIDVYGRAVGSTGWATHAASFAYALNRLTPVRLRTSQRQAIRGLFGSLRWPIIRGLRHPPGDFGVIISGEPLQRDRTARWIVWETTTLPAAQRELCESTRFLWTPSSWGRKNLIANGIEPGRIAVVPEGVDTNFFRPSKKTPGRFRFLTVGKWENRKFTEGLVRAFAKEFGHNDQVELFLQSHNPYIKNFSTRRRIDELRVDGGNIITGSPCSRIALRQLYQSADCFVLPTRAEGWGLPILEAMACGIPAIVTEYSAPLDYLNDENGFPLRVKKMVEARDDDFGINTGLWAEPDSEHLRHLMQDAFQDRERLLEKGRKARLTAEQFTWNHAAQVALKTIREHLS